MDQQFCIMYKLFEALNVCGQSQISLENNKKSKERIKHITSPSHKRSKKCDNQCVDCFLTFCLK